MVRKLWLLIPILAIAGGAIFFLTKKPQKRPGLYLFSFQKLEGGLIAKAAELEVKHDELKSPLLDSLLEKQREIYILLIYKQFIAGKKEAGDGKNKVTIYIEKPKRSLKSIFNQYGIELPDSFKPKFESNETPGTVANVDGKTLTEMNIDRKDLLWMGVESELFQHQLDAAEKRIKEQALLNAAEKENVRVQDYIAQKIMKDVTDVSQKDKRIDYFTEKYLIKLPILVDLEEPQWQPEIKEDWTPHFGDPKAEVKMAVFIDFFSDASHGVIASLGPLKTKFPGLFVGVRPFFSEQDEFQRLTAEANICVWTLNKEAYWNFLDSLRSLDQKEVEKNIYAAGEKAGIKTADLKTCLVTKKHKDVVDYHLKYGRFLGILNAPVIFINGEVLLGVVTSDQIEKIIRRKLKGRA